jgi:hypothetical protein
MPEGAIYVGRPGRFGNPFPVDIYGREKAIDLFKRWLSGNMSASELSSLSRFPEGSMVTERQLLRAAISRLRGHDLACWCPLDQPCHADVLLELANVTQCPEGSAPC